MDLEGKRVVVTGGSRGIGLGIVEALVDRKARVTVVARGAEALAETARRLGVEKRVGDVTDEAVARAVLGDVKPDVLVLNAGATPAMGPIHELTWDEFRGPWETDVKAALFWIRNAMKPPLARGSRVLLTSSGAAIQGSPLSGGYAGAKRTVWLMAQYANRTAQDLDLGITFQTLVPRQMFANTKVGESGARAYAAKQGVSLEKFFAGFGKAISMRDVGEHVATLLTDPQYERGVAFAVKGDTGLTSLD